MSLFISAACFIVCFCASFAASVLSYRRNRVRGLEGELTECCRQKEALRSKLYSTEDELAEAKARIDMLRMGGNG